MTTRHQLRSPEYTIIAAWKLWESRTNGKKKRTAMASTTTSCSPSPTHGVPNHLYRAPNQRGVMCCSKTTLNNIHHTLWTNPYYRNFKPPSTQVTISFRLSTSRHSTLIGTIYLLLDPYTCTQGVGLDSSHS